MEDNEYKRMFEEQRSENIKLKFSSEKQKKEVEELQAQLAAETGALKAAEAKAAAAQAAAVKEAAAKEDKPDKPEKPPKPVQFERRAPRGKLVCF